MRVIETKCIVSVVDMERATGFYRDVFGADLKFTSTWWSDLVIAGVSIGLHGGATDERRASGLGFVVDDIQAVCGAVERAGGSVVSPPKARPDEGNIILASIADAEGNEIALSEAPR